MSHCNIIHPEGEGVIAIHPWMLSFCAKAEPGGVSLPARIMQCAAMLLALLDYHHCLKNETLGAKTTQVKQHYHLENLTDALMGLYRPAEITKAVHLLADKGVIVCEQKQGERPEGITLQVTYINRWLASDYLKTSPLRSNRLAQRKIFLSIFNNSDNTLRHCFYVEKGEPFCDDTSQKLGAVSKRTNRRDIGCNL